MMISTEIRSALLALISRPGGFCRALDHVATFDGVNPRAVSAGLERLSTMELIHGVRITGRSVRYFPTVALADAFRVSINLGSCSPRAIGRATTARAVAIGVGMADAEIVVPADVKITLVSSRPDPRYYVDPAAIVPDGFLSSWKKLRSADTCYDAQP